MKATVAVMILAMTAWACQESESTKNDDIHTGNESVYSLQPGSEYTVSGTVTFKERKDGTADVQVVLSGTEGNVSHPVHLHLGNIAVDGADVAAQLNPVSGSSGKSETHLTQLADESSVTYKQLIDLDACIKIHLSASGPEQKIVLAGGNIGAAFSKDATNGRVGVSACKSE